MLQSGRVKREACICCFDTNGNKLSASSGTRVAVSLADALLVVGRIKTVGDNYIAMEVTNVRNGDIEMSNCIQYIIGNVYRIKINEMVDFILL